MMRRAVVGIALLGVFFGGVYALGRERTRAANDPARVAREFGTAGEAWRFSPPHLNLSAYRFALHHRGDGEPCMSYRVPGYGGGGCFVAVDDGGWALEAVFVDTHEGPLVIGAAVLETYVIRVGSQLVRTGPASKRFGLRFFAARVSRAAVKVPRNDIVALDVRGRLLGRQHWNEGGGNTGARNGLWEKEFDRRARG